MIKVKKLRSNKWRSLKEEEEMAAASNGRNPKHAFTI